MMKNVITISIVLLFLFPMKDTAQNLEDTRKAIDSLVCLFPGEVGVSIVSDTSDTIQINESHRFPLMSVVKFHQALAVYSKCKDRGIMLDKRISVKKRDMMENTWSPMRDRNPEGGKYTISELLKLSLIESDNNACNILSDKFVNMKETNNFIHSVGIIDCSISVDERCMTNDTNVCYNNWSTPKAATELLEWLYKNRASYKFVWTTMAGCNTGENRIPRYLKDVTIVHKTGTGPTLPNGDLMAVNDVASVVLPNNRHYNIAVFIKNAKCDLQECEKLIADISRLFFEYITKQ